MTQTTEYTTLEVSVYASKGLADCIVLVVDDEPLVAGMLRTFLESSGHNASVYLEGEETVTSFRGGAFD